MQGVCGAGAPRRKSKFSYIMVFVLNNHIMHITHSTYLERIVRLVREQYGLPLADPPKRIFAAIEHDCCFEN